MKIYILVLTVLLPLSSVIGQKNWIYAGTTQNKDKIYFQGVYASKDSSQFHDEIKIWVKLLLSKWSYRNKIYRNVQVKQLWQIDCKTNKYRYGKSVVYSNGGNILNSSEAELSEYTDPVPESIADILSSGICNYFNK